MNDLDDINGELLGAREVEQDFVEIPFDEEPSGTTAQEDFDELRAELANGQLGGDIHHQAENRDGENFPKANGQNGTAGKDLSAHATDKPITIHIDPRPDHRGHHLVEVQHGEYAAWHSQTLDVHDPEQRRKFQQAAYVIRPKALRVWCPSGDPPARPDWLDDEFATALTKLREKFPNLAPDRSGENFPKANGNPDAEPEPWRVELLSAPDNRGAQQIVAYRDGVEFHRDKIDPQQAWQRTKFIKAIEAKKPPQRMMTDAELQNWSGSGTATTLAEDLEAQILAAAKRWEVKQKIGGGARPLYRCMKDIKPEAINWGWGGRIALGKYTLISSDPGLGKSTLIADLAARFSRGTKWPDGSGNAPLGSCIIVNCEDEAADTTVPRVIAAGGDLSRVFVLDGVRSASDGEHGRQFDIARDMPTIELMCDEIGDVIFLGIDPLPAHIEGIDHHKNGEVRTALVPLCEFAARRGIAVIGVSHLTKGDGPAVYRSTGSLAYTAAARAAFVLTRDKAQPERRLFLPVKNNIGNDRTGLAFILTTKNGVGTTPHIEWEPDPVTTTADEALASRQPRKGPEPTERDRAEECLREMLKGGPRPTKDVIEEAKQKHCIKSKTLERARQELNVIAYQLEPGAPWWLRLPTQAPHQTAKLDPGHSLPDALGNQLGAPGVFEVPSDAELAARTSSKSGTVTETPKNAKNVKKATRQSRTPRTPRKETKPKKKKVK